MSAMMDHPSPLRQPSPRIVADDDDDNAFVAPPSPKRRSVAEAIETLTLNSERSVQQDGRADSLLSSQPSTPSRPADPSRSTTEPSFPSPSMLVQPISPLPSPRSRSPYSRSHTRSRSTSYTPSAPAMARANSLPTSPSMNQSLISPAGSRSQSPYRSGPPRARSPLRNSLDEPNGFLGGAASGIPESIHEDAELDLTPKQQADNSTLAAYQPGSGPLSFPRRRRPSSPLHQVLSAAEVTPSTSQPSTPNQPHDSPTTPGLTSSPQQKDPSRFNEAFPQAFAPYASSISSSIPSTPSSIRSRSPSISSLETIPDSPDAEQAAVEEDEVLSQRLARSRQRNNSDSSGSSTSGDAMRPGLDVPERGRTSVIAGGRKGDQKKRWSVCGHERWGDRDLETIWED